MGKYCSGRIIIISSMTISNIPNDFIYKHHERQTCARRSWVIFTWLLTWWIPSFTLGWCGMRRKDVQQAWREKVTICIVIFLSCACTLFFIIGFPRLICPRETVMSIYEVQMYNTPDKPYIYAYGRYYDITTIYNDHIGKGLSRKADMDTILGTDVSAMFYPAMNWDSACPNIPNPGPNWDNLYGERDTRAFWPHNALIADTNQIQDFLGMIRKYTKGNIVWGMQQVGNMANKDQRTVIVMFDNVYDVSSYMPMSNPFFDDNMKKIFQTYAGADVSVIMQKLLKQDPNYYTSVVNCMNHLFYIGGIDHRSDLRCRLSNWILVAFSGVMALIVLVKFLLACVGRRSKSRPERLDKAVIFQVPCYTEGTDELEGTFDSIAMCDYDYRNKLMIVVCDGIVTGGGNAQCTPELALEALFGEGNIPQDVKPLSYEAMGHGRRAHNLAKVYSGIWEKHEGHKLPFIVIVKCGYENEGDRAGNRGKRDSQVLLMRFLRRVYGNEPMTPLELEIWCHFEHIGRSPEDYEFFTMVDADTQIVKDSLNTLVSAMLSDTRIVGVCGETIITNPKKTWVSRLQVYEYFISHHMGKAFESSFGSVTCLPGCYCMYRIRDPVKKKKLYLVSPQIVDSYAVTKVDTLHKKNLLSLGEDRYLTTLILRAGFKTIFVPGAKCETNVPEHWGVFLSQRRRWINSTIHNLWELLGLDRLCGCMCFGLRFVILIELIAAMVGPATVLYIWYLAVMVALQLELLPIVSLIMLGAIFGLQALIVVMRMQWEHLVWMLFYMFFSYFPPALLTFCVPIYAFWCMDDFSWGDTRVVVEEGGKRRELGEADDYFDVSTIPRMTFSEFKAIKADKELRRQTRAFKKLNKSSSRSREGSIVSDVRGGGVSFIGLPQMVVPSAIGTHSIVGYNMPRTEMPQSLYPLPPPPFGQWDYSSAVGGDIHVPFDDIDIQSSVSNPRREKRRKGRG